MIIFFKENKFKGITGIFQISDQKINHILAFIELKMENLKNFLTFLKAKYL